MQVKWSFGTDRLSKPDRHDLMLKTSSSARLRYRRLRARRLRRPVDFDDVLQTYDRSVEAAMMGAFVTGPLVGLVAAIVGFLKARPSTRGVQP